MKLSTRSRYALRVLVNLARRYGMGTIPLGEITKEENLSQEYVDNILRNLRDAGIVELRRGPSGGCALKVDPAELTVWDVLNKVDDFNLVPCDNFSPESKLCPNHESCPTTKFWRGLANTIKNYLAGKTLADLVREHIDSQDVHPFTYHI